MVEQMNWDWLTDSARELPIPFPEEISELDWVELERRLKELPLACARERIMSFCVNWAREQFYYRNESFGRVIREAILNTMNLIENLKDE